MSWGTVVLLSTIAVGQLGLLALYAHHAWPEQSQRFIEVFSFGLGWTESLTESQKLVRDKILADANEPERVWFEKWWLDVEVPGVLNLTLDIAGELQVVQSVNCDHTVRVVYRTHAPFLGYVRHESIFLIDRGHVAIEAQRGGWWYDRTMEQCYKDH
jgi:hypothetical protein